MKSFFRQNLALLAHFDPALARRMESVAWPVPAVELLEARSGAATAKAVGPDGASLFLHSEYDPVLEARQFVDGKPPGKSDICALNGFGLGYAALEIAARTESRRWIACVEAREDVFRAALEGVDLAALLGRGRVKFFVGHNWIGFQDWLRALLSESEGMTLTLLTHPPSVRLLPPFYANAGTEVETAVNRRCVEINTLVHMAPEMERNALRNLRAMTGSHGVRDFEGAFAGLPAIVVAAGPSLTAAIPHLRRARGRAPVIAAGKALRLLLSEGIVPEFAVSLDMSSSSASCFRGFEIPPEVTLVFDPDSFHEIPVAFPGPRVSYETVMAVNRWARSFLGELGILEKGLSVAHAAFFFARATGADPILLSGVDLAFPGERTHAEGVAMTWGGDTRDLNAAWVMIPGVDGKPVRSLPNFRSFVTAFEGAIVRTPARVIQTSGIGAMIRGAEHLPLDAAMDRYVTHEAPVAERVRAALRRPLSFDAGTFDEATRRALAGAARAGELAEAGLRHVKRLDRLDPANKLEREEYRKIVAKANAAKDEILRMEEIPALFQRLLSGVALDVKNILREVHELDKNKNLEKMKLERRQFEAFFEGYLGAARFFSAELGAVRQEVLKNRDH